MEPGTHSPFPKLRQISILICTGWIIIIAGLVSWEISEQKRSIMELAAVEARASFNIDLVYRRWSAGHGGTYVPVTEQTPPNPHLVHVKERDITTPSGRALTLVNPAYMTRQVHELGKNQYGVKGHITSLIPLRPENLADAWEKQALTAFENGTDEIQSVSLIDGEPHLRLMRPMATEKGCLKCHAHQGYKEGEIRGGISVSVPLAPYEAIADTNIFNLILVHMLIIFLGLTGLGIAFFSLNKQARKQKEVETSLRESEKKYRNFITTSVEGIYSFKIDPSMPLDIPVENQVAWFNKNAVLDECNDEFAKMYGHQCSEETMGLRFSDLLADNEQTADTSIRFLIENGYGFKNTESRKKNPSGENQWFLNNAFSMFKQGKLVRVWGAQIDITLRKQSELILKKELFLNRVRADISREIMAREYDINKISDITLDYALRLTGSEHGVASSIDPNTGDIIGHAQTDMFSSGRRRPKDGKIIFPPNSEGTDNGLWGHALNTRQAVFTNTPETLPGSKGTLRGHVQVKNGMAVPVIMGEALIGMIALANSKKGYTELDLMSVRQLAEIYALALHRQAYETDRVEMEKNLRQHQKNEAIGALAGGIAHDFNNILFPIMGFAELLEDDLPPGSPLKESAREIVTGAQRAKELVKQILTFSRRSDQEIKAITPHLIIKEVVKLMSSTIPANIEIQQNISPDTRTILADPTQIHQIAMNLITNACHAMQDTGGTLSITLENQDLDSGPGLRFAVQDTGEGMDPATIEKIFDPYFSTKPQGKGTGLGLSVVKGIVGHYRGEIEVHSTPGKGSVFNIYLPAYENAPPTDPQIPVPPDPRGNEKILLVDDQAPVLRLTRQMLERLGYAVDICENGEEALTRIKSFPDRYDLLITDMTMPKMTGETLAREAREITPGLPVIICTGFSEKLHREPSPGIHKILTKPVVKTEMARAVRQVLDSRPPDEKRASK